MCQKSTAHEQCRSRGESRKLRFGSNRTALKIWQEGRHDLHSPPQPIDWREHTIGAVHDRNFPQERDKYQKITKISCDIGSRFEASWLDLVTMTSEMMIAVIVVSASCDHFCGLIPAGHGYLDSVAWPCHDCEVAPVWHHDVTNARTCQFFAVCLTVVPFEFWPRTFTIGIYEKKNSSYQCLLFWSAVFL